MPPVLSTVARAMAALLLLVGVVATGSQSAAAHAELESASPPVGGSVTSLPPKVTLVFSEEVKPGTAVVEVTGPDGSRVDVGDASVDLTDPERTSVIVSLFAGGAGEYSVHWETVSNADDDPASGNYSFTVVSSSAGSTPSAAGTPIIPTAAATSTEEDETRGNPLDPEGGDFDGSAFAISVGAGLLALAAIAGFWYVVRPRNARFGSRSDREQG